MVDTLLMKTLKHKDIVTYENQHYYSEYGILLRYLQTMLIRKKIYRNLNSMYYDKTLESK